jgi:hypothetical protein
MLIAQVSVQLMNGDMGQRMVNKYSFLYLVPTISIKLNNIIFKKYSQVLTRHAGKKEVQFVTLAQANLQLIWTIMKLKWLMSGILYA